MADSAMSVGTSTLHLTPCMASRYTAGAYSGAYSSTCSECLLACRNDIGLRLGLQFPDQYGMMAVGTHAQQQQSAFVGLNGVMYPLQQPPPPRMAPAFLSQPLSVNGSQHGHERSGSGGPPELAWHHQQQMSGLPLRPSAFVLQQQMQLQMQMQHRGHGGGRPHDQQQFAYMMPPPFVPGGSPGGPPLQYAAGMQTLPAGYQPGFQILPAGMPGMVPQHYAMAPQYQVCLCIRLSYTSGSP